MTITINLLPETITRLEERAGANGQSVEEFVQKLVEREISGNGRDSESAPAGRKSLSEILTPVHDDFQKSEITEQELDELIEETRQEIWQEQQVRKQA